MVRTKKCTKFIVSALLNKDPAHLRELITRVPDVVKEILKDKELVHSILKKDLGYILILIAQVSDMVTQILSDDRALVRPIKNWQSAHNWENEKESQVALEKFMTPFKAKSTSDILADLHVGGTHTLASIMASDEINRAQVKAKGDVEDALDQFGTLGDQKLAIENLQQQIKKLDNTLTEISMEEWISAKNDFFKQITDDSIMRNALSHAKGLETTLTKYLKELDTLVSIKKSIDKLKSQHVNVTEINNSLDQ